MLTIRIKFHCRSLLCNPSLPFRNGKAVALCVLCMIICSTTAFGQARIEGDVRTGDGAPVPFANVLLMNASDSTLAKGVITDVEGKFVLEGVASGNFYIIGTMVGYKKTTLPALEIAHQKKINLSPLVLSEETVQLNEVMIEAQKAMFQQEADRLVINVQNSITSAGNTVLEVLQKSPGIIVNRHDNSIIMYGKSGVRIMMNGKMMQLPTDAAVQLLDGMSAANVEKIELITTPPANFDAEGNSGIIHILMKENADFGTHATVGLTLGYKWSEVYGTNLNLQQRSKKAAYFANYSFLRERNRHIMNMFRQSVNEGFNQQITDSSSRKMMLTTQNLRTGAEFAVTGNSTLSLLVTASRRNWDMDALTYDLNYAAPDSTVITDMAINEINIWQSASAGIKWLTRPDPNRQITFDLDYIYYDTDNPSDYDNNVRYPETDKNDKEKIDITKRTPMTFLVSKLDYAEKISPSFELETGIKYVASGLDNHVLVQRWKDDVWLADPAFSSDATLSENMAAAYVSGKWQNTKGINISGGVRYEHTRTYISTPAKKGIIDRNYGNFFPSFFIKKDIDKEKDISFSYSRRITRPTFRDIAPFVFFWSPNTFSSGNTALWPSITDGLRVGYHSGAWILTLQYSHSSNEISFFQPEVDSQGNLIYRSQNLRYLNTLNFTNSFSFAVVPWWEVQTNVTGQYQTARTGHLEDNASLAVYNINVHVNNQIKLPKDFSVEISGSYFSKSIFGIAVFMPMGSVNAGIQKKFGNSGVLRLAMDDIFYTYYWRVNTDLPQMNLNSRIRYDWHNQFVRLTYTRNFGNKKLRSVQVQPGSEEERRRGD
jgi:hypothetical protein